METKIPRKIIIRDKFKNTPTEDLSYIIGRYCGPSNLFICEKTFDIALKVEDIEELMAERAIEEMLSQ